ncbi:MAG TPA: GNAT family N-acetyltransferase, partial [Actinomycetota bacterium]|nr:GNAT family N-acetyltransferase [Actinomycetota bacterium]
MNIRPMTEDDREPFVALIRQAFNQAPPFVARMRELPIDTYRVATESGRIVAAAAVLPTGHFFGGTPVACAGVSAVVVAPHARGGRTAEILVGEMLKERRPVMPLSSLYPATVPIYRRLGYEYGAIRCTYRVPLHRLTRFGDALPATPWDDGDLDEVATAHRAWAAEHNGVMDRTPSYWERLCKQIGDDPVYRVLVREGRQVTGSLIYHQENGFHMDLVAHDLFWRTPAAARSLITYVARHHSLGRDFVWTGPSTDPMLFHSAEYKIREKERWHLMLRLLDVSAAVVSRGYRSGTETAVSVGVQDELFPENSGPWRIAVSGGKATAEPASDAEITMGVGTLASIYSGLITTH